MLKTIVKKGDPVLEKKCHAVTKFDDKLARLLDDMTQTLEQSGGVGLAAPPRSASAAVWWCYWTGTRT